MQSRAIQKSDVTETQPPDEDTAALARLFHLLLRISQGVLSMTNNEAALFTVLTVSPSTSPLD